MITEIDDDLHEQIAIAACAPDRLAANNRALHFAVDGRTGRVTVEVRDLDGNMLCTVPARKVLEIAAGGDL